MIRFGSYAQPNWDWRVAGNFMFGGTGSALVLAVALATYPQAPPPVLSLTALALVGLGLVLVWIEIGRPWRFLNVFFHPQASWMTREATVAMALFAVTLLAIWLGHAGLLALAALLGLLFLYCQGRILRASTGIPAWREPALLPLIMSTGMVEGVAVLILLLIATSAQVAGLANALILLLAVRGWMWFRYRDALRLAAAPAAVLQQLHRVHVPFMLGGHLVAGACALAAVFLQLPAALAIGAGLALLSGWYVKFVIITRAALVQGYGIGTLRRGRPTPRAPVRRHGDPWQG